MTEEDLYESMYNLNPCTDKLGKDRDFRDAVMQCIKYLDNKVQELERRLNEETKR